MIENSFPFKNVITPFHYSLWKASVNVHWKYSEYVNWISILNYEMDSISRNVVNILFNFLDQTDEIFSDKLNQIDNRLWTPRSKRVGSTT